MNHDEGDLLRALSSGARSRGIAESAAVPRTDTASAIGAASFQGLLEKARAGNVSSGLPVTIAKGAGVELTDEQLGRVAAAADRAQASGATRALVMIDGKAIKLDVGVRTITGSADLSSGKPLTGIDALIQIPSGPSATPAFTTPAAASSPDLSASLLKALSGREVRSA